MIHKFLYWCGLYEKLKHRALCLDVETTGINGQICVIGLYRSRDWPMEHESYVLGRNLSEPALQTAFHGCAMLITFNGRFFDVPRLRREFSTAIPPKMPIIDLYLFAKELNMKADLKVLEAIFRIERADSRLQRRGIAVKLWRRYESYGDLTALDRLLAYNREDTINLYPLAEELVSLARIAAGNSHPTPIITQGWNGVNPP